MATTKKPLSEAELVSALSQAKKVYTRLRFAMRTRIIEELNSQAGSTAVPKGNRGQRGNKDYVSRGSIAEFDNHNWMWIETESHGLVFSISLNALEKDPVSGNTHALFDRVSFAQSICKTRGSAGACVCKTKPCERKYIRRIITHFDLDKLPEDGIKRLCESFFEYADICSKLESAESPLRDFAVAMRLPLGQSRP